MGLDDLIKDFNKDSLLISLAIVGAVAGMYSLYKKIRGINRSSSETSVVPEMRSIADIRKSEEDSRIRGIVSEFYILQEGFSGVIEDKSGRVAFYFDNDNTDTYEEKGLVPLILGDSQNNTNPVEMTGEYDRATKVFLAYSLRGKIAGEDYKVGEV